MFSVLRVEHRDCPCLGPSTLFRLGPYAPDWILERPPRTSQRPKWRDDEVLSRSAELVPKSLRDEIVDDWYFGFASLDQLNEWFPRRWRMRHGWLKRGAVIREYRAPRVLFGATQCVMHHEQVELVDTFHIYRPNERI